MRIYISGKITGLPHNEVKENFSFAASQVQENYSDIPIEGSVEVVNPVELDHSEAIALEASGKTQEDVWHLYMAKCMHALLTCDAIYMLKNWGSSRGARIEYAIAKELGLIIEYQK